MLIPKRVKYRKMHRGRRQGIATRGATVAFGDYGLQAMEACWMSNRQIEAARRAMTRHVKRGGQIWIRVFPDKSITKKPAETRMGSGKGNPEGWVAVVKPGRMLFEMGGVTPEVAKEAMKLAAAKLPIKTRFVTSAESGGSRWVVASGVVLAFMGPQWWHDSSVGCFFNSLHFWSVQLFFIFMVLHLWGQYFMAGWRHGRAATWMIGVVIFGASILTAFTGYLSQQNFDSQFIAINAKDAMNGGGIGAFFNVLNFGQMYGLHIMLLPVLVTFLVVWHIVMVRMRGVVKPID